ncbi:MAG: superoxide dismutase family protein [Clostridia bacterium]|nr:superoxide dismutase family protein [Clostridia bacterium]
MDQNYHRFRLDALLRSRPQAWANLRGSALYPDLQGRVLFYGHPLGTLVVAEVEGLPTSQNNCASPIFGFHIHEGGACAGDGEDPFANVRMHYNPQGCPHPYHAGDLPPLFGANGYAFGACLTDRFLVHEVIGRTVIIHSSPDDFTTQPSGNAGRKIACGEIRGYVR